MTKQKKIAKRTMERQGIGTTVRKVIENCPHKSYETIKDLTDLCEFYRPG